MATDSVTIHLPDDLYRRLERLARLMGQPVENLIVRTLSSTLPPLPDDLAPVMRDALQALESQSDGDLWRLMRATLPADQYARVTELREQRAEGAITADDEATLTGLLDAADLLTLQKAYAAVLLKWRGHRLPSLAALSRASA